MLTALTLIVLGSLVLLSSEIASAVSLLLGKLRVNLKLLTQPKRIAKAQRAWPEFMDDVAAAVRSGLPLEQALIEATRRAPKDIARVLERFVNDLQSGKSLTRSLDSLLVNSIDNVGRRLVIALKIASVSGGKDVVTTLQILAESIRRDLQMLDELRAKQKSAITGARVSVLAPWLVIGLTSLQPSVRLAYQSSIGLVLLAAIGVISIIAYLWMLQIAKLQIGGLR
jgi:tight adherence protein B